MADSTLPPDSPSSSDDQLDADLERRLATLALLPVPSRPDLRAPIDGMVGADLADAPVHPIDLDADPNGVRPLPTVRLRRRVLVGLAAAVVLVIAGAALLALDRGDGSTIAGPAPAGTLADPDRPLVGTMWELTATIDGGATSTAFAGPGEARPVLYLVDEGGPARTFRGENGCQSVSGKVEIDGASFRVTERLTEANACFGGLDAADVFAAVLGMEATFAIDGSQLTITNGDRALVFVGSDLFTATTTTVPVPVPGEVATSSPTTMTSADRINAIVTTLWELESVVDGSVSTSAEPLGPHRRRATLSFTVDSSASAIVVAGNDGCNDFGGTAVVLDSTISFGSMGREDMACQGDEPVVAEALFQVLVGETTYSLDDGLLTITRDDRSLTFRPATER